jgi:putative drug exporter of the RND superfamily
MVAGADGFHHPADEAELVALVKAAHREGRQLRVRGVPAIMRFAGTANWWLPSWLERILPRIRVD